jgi:hypothetical protein
MTDAPYKIELSVFGRWIIVNARDPELAWSGSCWMEHEHGRPIGRAQISNFTTEEEARKHAEDVFGI